MVLLYTGLRASDAVLLKRSSIESGAIRTRTKKTNTPVVIPIHAALQAELAKPLPVESLYLVPGRRGQQMSVPAISSAIKRQFEMLGHDDRPPMHGLRKNAVTALIEAGCKPRQIQAITGQSLQMIEHYGQDYDRENLAAEAIHIWERQEKWQP
jgi:integrase